MRQSALILAVLFSCAAAEQRLYQLGDTFFGYYDYDGSLFRVLNNSLGFQDALGGSGAVVIGHIAPPSTRQPRPRLFTHIYRRDLLGPNIDFFEVHDALNGSLIRSFRIPRELLRLGWTDCGMFYRPSEDVVYLVGCIHQVEWSGLEFLKMSPNSGDMKVVRGPKCYWGPRMLGRPTVNPLNPDEYYWVWTCGNDDFEGVSIWSPDFPEVVRTAVASERLSYTGPTSYYVSRSGDLRLVLFNRGGTASRSELSVLQPHTGQLKRLWSFRHEHLNSAFWAGHNETHVFVLGRDHPGSMTNASVATTVESPWPGICVYDARTGGDRGCRDFTPWPVRPLDSLKNLILIDL